MFFMVFSPVAIISNMSDQNLIPTNDVILFLDKNSPVSTKHNLDLDNNHPLIIPPNHQIRIYSFDLEQRNFELGIQSHSEISWSEGFFNIFGSPKNPQNYSSNENNSIQIFSELLEESHSLSTWRLIFQPQIENILEDNLLMYQDQIKKRKILSAHSTLLTIGATPTQTQIITLQSVWGIKNTLSKRILVQRIDQNGWFLIGPQETLPYYTQAKINTLDVHTNYNTFLQAEYMNISFRVGIIETVQDISEQERNQINEVQLLEFDAMATESEIRSPRMENLTSSSPPSRSTSPTSISLLNLRDFHFRSPPNFLFTDPSQEPNIVENDKFQNPQFGTIDEEVVRIHWSTLLSFNPCFEKKHKKVEDLKLESIE